MRTNIEKWNYFKKLILESSKAFIAKNIEGIADELFDVSPNGNIKTLNVDDVVHGRIPWYSGKKPTREDLKTIKSFYENIDDNLSMDKVIIHYSYKEASMKVKGGVKYNDLGKKYFDSYQDALLVSTKLKEKNQKEQDLLDSGDYIRCGYCNKVSHKSKSISRRIIFRDSRPNRFKKSGVELFVNSKVGNYCSGSCAGNAQDACEG